MVDAALNPEDTMEVQYAPLPAVVGGEWLVVRIDKQWVNSRVRTATDDHQSGFTVMSSFEREVLLAYPIVEEEPKTPQPEGTVTMVQYEAMIKALVQLNRRVIAGSAQPINLSEF